MGRNGMAFRSVFCAVVVLCLLSRRRFASAATQSAAMSVDASPAFARRIPDGLFGISFEELNHAGVGGLWAELVSNRGFEAGGGDTPSSIEPWFMVGGELDVVLSTDRTSCFPRNPVALKMEVLCNGTAGSNPCPRGGVGVYNPGYWGMNIKKGSFYKVTMYLRSSAQPMELSVALASSDGSRILASHSIKTGGTSKPSGWGKVVFSMKAAGSNANSRLQITTRDKGTVWFDQISVMPADTYMGHGFRKDLATMLAELKPGFLRFPGGSYVEGEWMRNVFRWRDTVGPWEQRPGHLNDVWKYWNDDGLGFFEFLQLAEDLGASPVWVVNNGMSRFEHIPTASVSAFVEEVVDGIEFARGDASSRLGSLRAAMGHPHPFRLNHIAIGNQDCWMYYYQGNYLKMHSAIKAAYPDIEIVTNCDGSSGTLDHPADLYDVHVYKSASDVFAAAHMFDHVPRNGPKAFVSEYAVTGAEAGKGTLLAAIAQAGFLVGIEKNSDAVAMASCAPLFVNENDRAWSPDVIVFDSWRLYGTPSYWMQQLFRDSAGALLHPSTVTAGSYGGSVEASAITWKNARDGRRYLKIKVVNYGGDAVNMNITVAGLSGGIKPNGSMLTVLKSEQPLDENSFEQLTKVVPTESLFPGAGTAMEVVIDPHSMAAIDLLLGQREVLLSDI